MQLVGLTGSLGTLRDGDVIIVPWESFSLIVAGLNVNYLFLLFWLN